MLLSPITDPSTAKSYRKRNSSDAAEIISEVEPQALLNVNKRFKSGRKVRDSRELQEIFHVLGSNLTPPGLSLPKACQKINPPQA
jgi:hypothetical protein